MYQKHFGLNELPFGITPDTAYAYSLQHHQEAINTLLLALTQGEGFVKIIFSEPHGEILGAHIIGAHATEMIAELGLAIEMEATHEELISTIHAHPTLSESIHEAAEQSRGHAIHI